MFSLVCICSVTSCFEETFINIPTRKKYSIRGSDSGFRIAFDHLSGSDDNTFAQFESDSYNDGVFSIIFVSFLLDILNHSIRMVSANISLDYHDRIAAVDLIIQ